MNLSGATIASLIEDRGLNIATLARRSNVQEEDIANAISNKTDLSEEDITAIADALSVPLHVIYSPVPVKLFDAIDIRSKDPSKSAFSKGVLDAISFTEKLSHTLASTGIDLSVRKIASAIKTDLSREHAIGLAADWRLNWGLSIDEQLEYQDANKVYISLRSFIEDLGVVVVHNSFKTDEAAGIYAHVDGGPHTIIINTTQSSKARKLFTLGHEFCHFLIRKQGASNPSVLKNRVERFCNKFSAHLLAPDQLIYKGLKVFGYRASANNNFIRLFAKKLGISQEALVRRLVEIGLLAQAEYIKWRSQFTGNVPPGDRSDGKGGRGDVLKNKRTQYGNQLLRLLKKAKSDGELDEIDIYRLCGLKPKYQKQLFEA